MKKFLITVTFGYAAVALFVFIPARLPVLYGGKTPRVRRAH